MIKKVLTAICTAVLVLGIVGATLAFSPAAAVQVPGDFRITEYADLNALPLGSYRDPTALTVGPDGRVYVSLLNGRIYAFEDTDGDDQQDTYQLFFGGPPYYPFPAGMAWKEDSLYVSVPGEIRVLQDLDADGDANEDPENECFVGGLPETIQGLAFDTTGRLYAAVAAGCDACEPDDPRLGAVLRLEASAPYTETLYARGLRDAYGLGFYPGSDDLFAPDDGRDDLGPGAPPDELNFVQYGRHYGWPHCWDGGADPGWELLCTWTADPLVTFPAHSSPAGLTFHDGTAMPPGYTGNAFVALRDLGRVERVMVTPDGLGGYVAASEPFATGFDEPIDVAVGPDGAIYVADYTTRRVYCIRTLPDLSGSGKAVTPRDPAAGDRLTYTLNVSTISQGTLFTLTDPIPLSTTYVTDSAWASAGTITHAGDRITWQGVISPNATITATFAVQVDPLVPTRTAIVNTAVLTGADDPHGPYTLRAIVIIDPLDFFFPMVARSGR